MSLESIIRVVIFLVILAWDILTSIQQIKRRMQQRKEQQKADLNIPVSPDFPAPQKKQKYMPQPTPDSVAKSKQDLSHLDWFDSAFVREDENMRFMSHQVNTIATQSSINDDITATVEKKEQQKISPVAYKSKKSSLNAVNLDFASDDMVVDWVVASEILGRPRALNPDVWEKR